MRPFAADVYFVSVCAEMAEPIVMLLIGADCPRNHVLHEGHDPPPGGALLRVDICRHVVTYLRISALRPSQACPAHTVEMGCYI